MVSSVVTATIQATVLSATSNLLAQTLQAYREDRPFTIDPAPLLKYVIFTILNTPANFLWQQFLEQTFPGFTVKPVVVTTETPAQNGIINEKTGGNTTTQEILPEKRLNKTNTAIKFFLDQTFGALFNTIAFLAGIAALNGATTDVIVAKVKKETMPLMTAGYKLWPIVSLLNFTVIPFDYRIIFGGIVGVAWGIFLSLFASG